MRLLFIFTLVLCAASLASASFSLGPGGFSSSPINLMTVYRYIKSAWQSFTGTSTLPTDKADQRAANDQTHKNNNRDSKLQDSKLQESGLQHLKARIEAASQKAAGLTTDKVSLEAKEENPLLRTIVPSKRVVAVGKWPIVYGVLNGLLLGAALILAKPYFVDGETVVTKYEKEKLGEGDHSIPHPAYYKHNYYDNPPMPSNNQDAEEEEEEEEEDFSYGMTPKPSYNSEEREVNYEPTEETYTEAAPPRVRPKYSPKPHYKPKPTTKAYSRPPRPVQPTAAPPSYKAPVNHVHPTATYAPNLAASPSSYNNAPSVASNEFADLAANDSISSDEYIDDYEDPPMNELYYFNPTIFMSNEASSYGCLERMVCMDASKAGRSLIAPVTAHRNARNPQRMKRTATDDTGASWAHMIRRIDSTTESAEKVLKACAQYYCPPQVPSLDDQLLGNPYTPPPPMNHGPVFPKITNYNSVPLPIVASYNSAQLPLSNSYNSVQLPISNSYNSVQLPISTHDSPPPLSSSYGAVLPAVSSVFESPAVSHSIDDVSSKSPQQEADITPAVLKNDQTDVDYDELVDQLETLRLAYNTIKDSDQDLIVDSPSPDTTEAPKVFHSGSNTGDPAFQLLEPVASHISPSYPKVEVKNPMEYSEDDIIKLLGLAREAERHLQEERKEKRLIYVEDKPVGSTAKESSVVTQT